MTDGARRPLVRRAFLKWSLVVFVLLVPFVIHAVWDYVETRELNARLTAIAKRGEPLRVRPYRELKGDARTSQRYYRAAAVLASDFRIDPLDPPDVSSRNIFEAQRNGVWPAALVDDLRPVLARDQDVLTYADRAAALPFEGFSESSPYLTSQLFNVSRLCSLRAIVEATDGNGAAAIEALQSQARLSRAIDARFWRGVRPSDLQFVLSRTRPPKAALMRLAEALEDPHGGDDGLRRMLLEWRASFIESSDTNPLARTGRRNWADAIPRPWLAHRLNGELGTFDVLLAAASGPWPQQMDRVSSAVPQSAGSPTLLTRRVALLRSDAEAVARELATFRVERLAVAVEMYRRDHGEQVPPTPDGLVPMYIAAIPVDPFTGRALIVKKDAGSYSIYSVGPDRRDDGGDMVPRKAGEKRSDYVDGPDIGIRIQLGSKP